MRDLRATLGLLILGAVLAGYAGCTGGGETSSSSGAGGASSSPAATSSSGAGGDSTGLAMPCAVDGDCASGLICLTPGDIESVFGGSAPGGYCSKSCSLDIDCFGGAGACLGGAAGHQGRCVQRCRTGPALMTLNDPLSPDKCNGRNDLRCASIEPGLTACMPTCGQDSQCPAGRFCDGRRGVCVDQAPMGKAEGEACDPSAKPPECAGVCVSFTSGATACADICVLGGAPDPAMTPNCHGPTSGYCIYAPGGYGAGDQGYCAPACKQHDQCQSPAFFCKSVPGLTGVAVDNGYCRGAVECPNGPADCTDMATACTSTKFGPYCLDPIFPLGSDGAGGGGGASGSGGAGGAGGAGAGGGSDAGAD